MSGRSSAFDPPGELASLLANQEKLKRELCAVEQQIYNLETNYLSSSVPRRTSKSDEANPAVLVPVEGRLFSSSSVTSPASDVKDAAAAAAAAAGAGADDRTSSWDCAGATATASASAGPAAAAAAAAGSVLPRRRGRPKKAQQLTGTAPQPKRIGRSSLDKIALSDDENRAIKP